MFGPPSCGNPKCDCADPTKWPVCEEFMELDDDTWCFRCGWNHAAHEVAP